MGLSRNKVVLSVLEKMAREKDEQLSVFHGPMPLKDSEKNLQKVMREILNKDSKIIFDFDSKGELYAKWGENSVNITASLADNPSFNHIQVRQEDLDNYVNYTKNTEYWAFKPSSFDAKEYASDKREEALNHKELHLGEKIAINMYTKDYSWEVNEWLRENGKPVALKSFIENYLGLLDVSTDKFQKLAKNFPKFQTHIKDMLLLTIIATSGLDKIKTKENLKALRIDINLPQAVVDKIKSSLDANQLSREAGFYSATSFEEKQEFSRGGGNSCTLIIDNYESKPVKLYSANPDEQEVLTKPGVKYLTLFHYKDKEQNKDYFVKRPVRSLGFYTVEKRQVESSLKDTTEYAHDLPPLPPLPNFPIM